MKTDTTTSSDAPRDAGEETLADLSNATQPRQIGRYRIEKLLGQGGFGLVYLAHDDQLQRLVAIKVPHHQRLSAPEDAAAYLTEARTVAGLDYPNIVPVYDVGSTEDFPCYIVSKYVEGFPLSRQIKENRPSPGKAAELVATIAKALHYAHRKRLVHRDVKPGNILIDASNTPFVVDFGMALKEENVGKGFRYAGTPAYMSPEQARGEGHRVDGRSDIFSLGVVFYELLAGRRPFNGDSQSELLEQVRTFEPRPPRQCDDGIPRELERICMKALAKRAAERYSTASDLADDLRHWLDTQVAKGETSNSERLPYQNAPSGTPSSHGSRPFIVPKGLRSFDAHDADFFLELLPGPRDREGLPDSIRFWKTRIEETDADDTFAVGLIYGPSGCGKSSLMKAGLLPRLSGSVIAVYVEATAEETEARLLNGLRKRCPNVPSNLNLRETLAALRRGEGVPAGKKVLIVLDQFEQWLHSRKDEPDTELVQALRQCDGRRVQCVIMVRDDFWLAVSRFLRELEVPLREGQNIALADLFDTDHARKVLAAFGRAFGKLPENSGQTTADAKQFLNQAVSGLAQAGKVVSVRLALFAEMMKGRPWTLASLTEVGGTEGVGVTFLEETFSAATAPPEHRYHQKAARAVLKSLLPDSGTDIKGHMRSRAELLEASGYVNRRKDFDDLVRILDSEIRLLTPTDPEGKEGVDESTTQAQPGCKYYQLTHDYLVPALRDWLTRKQKETRRGRAELLLADRAGVWNARPESRQLPSLRQWLSIRFLTKRKNWAPPQRKMMDTARRNHSMRGAALALLLAVATVAGLTIRSQVVEQQKATQAAGLVKRLLDADTGQVPAVIIEMAAYRRWADPLLRQEDSTAPAASPQKLRTSLALLPVDPGQVDFLYWRLLTAQPNEVPIIRDALFPYKDALIDKLWSVVSTPEKGKEATRLRAAAALAKYDPDGQKWAAASPLVVNDLVRENPVFLGQWSESFRLVKNQLLPALKAVFRDPQPERLAERNLATNLLADYAANQPQVLGDLLMDADAKQFAAIFPKFIVQAEKGLPILTGEVDRKLSDEKKDEDKEKLAKRQANAAVALLRMNQPGKVWPLLQHTPDPRARSYLIDRLSPLGADPKALMGRLQVEPDLSIRMALILSLGEFGEQDLPEDERKLLTAKLQDVYRTEPDPGLHAAAEWLLRTWEQEPWLKIVNEEWAADEDQRSRKLNGLAAASTKPGPAPQWYVNSQAETMVAIPGPVEFLMGSPGTESDRLKAETLHKRRIGRTFAVSSKAVTFEQYRKFDSTYEVGIEVYIRVPNLPVIGISWYQAAAYCNWLSKQEKIPEDQWCYKIENGKVTKLREKYLSLTGYRLPTEAEIEYATRAGALTSRYYGETEELLPKYAWFSKNSDEKTWPVGTKKPNELGFFDLHGNTFCWCQEAYADYPAAIGGDVIEDKEGDLNVSSTAGRVLRGGAFDNHASEVRCAWRNFRGADDRGPRPRFPPGEDFAACRLASSAVGRAILKAELVL